MQLLPVFALLVQQAAAQGAAPAGRVVVTPANPRVVQGDTIRLSAQVMDAQGRPLQATTIRYQVAGAEQVAEVDSMGRVVGIVPGSMPVAAVAIIPGRAPIVSRIDIRVVPAPAGRVVIETKPQRMLVGQRLRLPVRALTPTNDPAADAIAWSSSAPAVVRVENGALVAAGAGRATVTASAGKGRDSFDVTVQAGAVSRVTITPASTAART
ncbi:MAG TPA: hypothetical protein VFX50_15680, partial [Gemmatimonadales bacterium]|nr:hypothetical protein [Gemmatimonadales bacterium]